MTPRIKILLMTIAGFLAFVLFFCWLNNEPEPNYGQGAIENARRSDIIWMSTDN